MKLYYIKKIHQQSIKTRTLARVVNINLFTDITNFHFLTTIKVIYIYKKYHIQNNTFKIEK